MHTSIPLDVLVAIVDEVALLPEKARETLTACSLVCRSLLVPSRKQLFYKIDFGAFELSLVKNQIKGPQRFKRLFRLVKKNPSIARLIRELCFMGYFLGSESDNRSWILKKKMVAALIDHLPMLQALSFSKMSEKWELSWEDQFTEPLKSSLRGLIRANQLSSLRLDSVWEIPIALLTQCPCLKHLSISRCTLDITGAEPESLASESSSNLSPHFTRLRSFQFGDEPRSIPSAHLMKQHTSISGKDCFSELESLCVTTGEEHDIDIAMELVRGCSHSLLHLIIEADKSWVGAYPPPLPGSINLSVPQALKSISLPGGIDRDIELLAYTLTGIFDVLKTAPSSNSIEEIGFNFTSAEISSDDDDDGIYDLHGWARLDAVLTGPTFPALRQVNVKLYRSGYGTRDGSVEAKYERMVRDALPGISAHSRISLGIKVNILYLPMG